ncbi:hypothetical protein CCR85_04130 [Rhodothalassium salexigens]|uniref:hypothetical protein n=1 Tax=Rhodothalassium salexigens TaxID=1086 RepID=UPI001912AB60|nr:hypothetical protein [Rhodothalassium salexigens]MBK5910679.1 hypothetical protein [Rhodothalassium salexigens]MBK5920049.1 hypothetical protein [Rhodothalassium salexigens]
MSNEDTGKSGPSPIVFALVALLIGLGGGGAAVYFLMPAKAPETAAATDPAEDKAAEVDEASDILHVNVRRFSAPLISQRGTTLGYVWIDVDFVVDGPTNQSLLSARLPRVKNAMLKALHSAPTASVERPGALDVKQVEARMRAAAKAAAGDGVIHQMFITNVQRAPT